MGRKVPVPELKIQIFDYMLRNRTVRVTPTVLEAALRSHPSNIKRALNELRCEGVICKTRPRLKYVQGTRPKAAYRLRDISLYDYPKDEIAV